jgi:hypothetical protein
MLLTLNVAVAFSSLAQDDVELLNKQGQHSPTIEYSTAQLEQMLAPIALYPDSLLTHILIAATYPLEIVQASRWLEKQGDISASLIESRSADKDWDASIKALLPFASVVSKLNEDLNWTQQLGEAFLSDESAVLTSVQSLRNKAQKAGHLDNIDNMQVSYESNSIIIEPNTPQVVYVPYYDSRVVYGQWHWNQHPPVYWVTPRHLYSQSYSTSHYKPFYWHSAVHIANNLFFGAVHWHNRHVVIVHPTYHYSRAKRHYGHRPKHYNRQQIVSSHSAKRWQHKPHHRRGVSYQHKPLKRKYNQKVRSVASNSLTHRRLVKDKAIRLDHKNKNLRSENLSSKYSTTVANTTKHSKVTSKLHSNKNEARKHHNSKINNRNIDKNRQVFTKQQHQQKKPYRQEQQVRSQQVRAIPQKQRASPQVQKQRTVKSSNTRHRSSSEKVKQHSQIAQRKHSAKQRTSRSSSARKHN